MNGITLDLKRLSSVILANHRGKLVVRIAADACIVLVAYFVAFSVRVLTTSLDFVDSVWAFAGAALVIVTMLYAFGVYRRIWSRTSGHGITLIVKAIVIASCIIGAFNFLVDPRPLPISIIVTGNALALAGIISIRYRSRLISGLSWRWRAVWHREFPDQAVRVLIIGAGESGQTLAWRLQHRFPGHNYRIVGFIDDDPDKLNMYVENCPVLGNRHDLLRLAEKHQIDLIVVAIHNISGTDFREVLALCEHTKALIKVVPNLFAMVKDTHSASLLRDVQPEDLIGRSPITNHKGIDLTKVQNRVVLITGAAGSIGSELSRQILKHLPRSLILLDNNESGLHDLSIELKARSPQLEIIPVPVDITRYDALKSVYAHYHPHLVFHAAAYKHVPMLEKYPSEAVHNNIIGTRNVAELARDYGVERFVLISTDKAVRPSSVMGASKRVCELLLHALASEKKGKTIFTAVRFGNVLGSRGSVVPTFERQIENGGPVTVTHREMTRYFMSIPEAANLIIHAAALTTGNDIFILKMGEVVRIVELAERMIRLRGLRPYIDIDIQFTGIRSGEKMHEELFNPFEVASETAHPSIMKHNAWPQDFDASTFKANLDKLQEIDFASVDKPLEALLALINSSDAVLSETA